MLPQDLEQLAARLLAGELTIEEFVRGASRPMTADLGDAQVDLDRRRRCGFPEVVFAEGKSVAAMERIFAALLEHGADVLATRVSAEQAAGLAANFPAGRYNAVGRTFRIPAAAGPQRMTSLAPALVPGALMAAAWRLSPPARATCRWPKRPAKRPSGPGRR